MVPRDLIGFAYTSEWALAKFFTALFEDGVSETFNLAGICGREKQPSEVIERLTREIGERYHALESKQDWRYNNTLAEIRSATYLIERLRKVKLKYYSIANGNAQTIPEEEYDGAIFTTNLTHLDYISALAQKGHNILCEKPLVIVTDRFHKADRTQLDKLEEVIDEIESRGIVAMDAEHYSAKKATMTFYERVGDMVMKYGRISKVEAHTSEKDDPNKIRTRNLLSKENRTGLLLDMGVHLFGVISNIGGTIPIIHKAVYGCYPGNPDTSEYKACGPYNVETYVETEFKIQGNFFHPESSGKFVFEKFIDRIEGNDKDIKDSKKLKVTFRNDSGIETEVIVDFNQGTVISSDKKEWKPLSYISSNEYSNILREFGRAIRSDEQSRTSFKRSVQNLDTIYRIYRDFPFEDNKIKVYRTIR